MIIKAQDMNVEQRTGEREGTLTTLLENSHMHNKSNLFAKITLKPGRKTPYHKHEGDCEVYYIVSGHAQVNDNGSLKDAKAGDIIFTDNGESHSLENIGDTDLEFIALILKL